MRFLMTSTGKQSTDEALYIEMGKFMEELTSSGVLLATGGMDLGTTLFEAVDGTVTVTDGPFAEAREVVGGFALIEVRSKEEAVELTRRFFKIIGDGEGRMHRILD
ncbi:YciI family protein [Embleya scabrispora]|uniref:YciI family protein n=1 Tax=Embleya scabrispora TaxID=159449 RepID=UPI00037FED07|nr:YciI family protein [Embleya scabrispora]MYS81640.1 hypothetical protein [Streptomyces sp. SID5474]